jgi:hypothetical protein
MPAGDGGDVNTGAVEVDVQERVAHLPLPAIEGGLGGLAFADDRPFALDFWGFQQLGSTLTMKE